MYHMFLVMFFLVAIILILLVMLQQDKGSNIGSFFSCSASINFLNSSISSNFIFRITIILGILFFILSLILGNISIKKVKSIDDSLLIDKHYDKSGK